MYDQFPLYATIPDAIRSLLPDHVIKHCEAIFKKRPFAVLECIYSNRGEMSGDVLIVDKQTTEAWGWAEGETSPAHLPRLPDVKSVVHYWSMVKPMLADVS